MAEDPKKEETIVVRDVWKRYGELEVLKGLNLTVFKGETLVILGRSGVGKSVLLRQIIGMERPERGTIEVEGKLLSQLKEKERIQSIKKMGMLFQGAALFDSMNVKENTAFPLREHGHPETGEPYTEKEINERVAEALEMVNLSDAQNKMPSELSGGMRKRAGLARMIIYRPHILLYDEPTTGLDPITAQHINELIVKTQKELNATSIVVTHDIRSALETGDRLALHHDGQIAIIESKSLFFTRDHPIIQKFFENVSIAKYHVHEK